MRLRQDRQLGGVPGEGLLRRSLSRRIGRSGPPVCTTSTRTPSPTPYPRPPASWSSTPRAWTRPSPTTRNARPIPKWIEKGITHDERLSSKRATGLSAPGPVQPRTLACPRPVRRHPLEQGSNDRQGQRLRRLSLRALLDATRPTRGQEESGTATSFACTTSAAACCAAPWCSNASCPGASPSTTGPGPTTSSRRGWTAAAPSTPSPRRV